VYAPASLKHPVRLESGAGDRRYPGRVRPGLIEACLRRFGGSAPGRVSGACTPRPH